MSGKSIAEQVAKELSPYLGPFNARVAVKTFSKKSLNLPPEELTVEHLPDLLESLRRLLRAFIGHASTDSLLSEIQRRVK